MSDLDARIRLDVLHKAAATKRRGYLAAYHAAGRIEAGYLVVPWPEYSRLQERFAGWGDQVHRFLAPIVRFLDSHFGTHLAGCGGCRGRQHKLNRLELRVKRWLARAH